MNKFIQCAVRSLVGLSLLQAASAGAEDVRVDFSVGPAGNTFSPTFTDGATGLQVNGLYLPQSSETDPTWAPADLFRRDDENDHGFGVCNPREERLGGGDCDILSGNSNELDNRGGPELITLKLPPGYQWVSVQVSSLDHNDGGELERGFLYRDDDGEPNSVSQGSLGDEVIAALEGGDEIDEIERIIPIDDDFADSPYLMFEAFDWREIEPRNDNNDYLVFAATIRRLPAALGDFVWEDTNGNGIQDCNDDNGNGIIGDAGDTGPECDAGIPDVEVTLLDPVDGNCDTDDREISTTQTDTNGFYIFDGLEPGNYCVRFNKSSIGDICDPIVGDLQFTFQNQGDNDAKDSDANPANGLTNIVALDEGEINLTVDSGVFCPAKIGDTVIDDENRDGIQDPQEPGIPEVTVELFACESGQVVGTPIRTTTTDEFGMYMFGGVDDPLPPGEYAVKFDGKSGSVFSTKDVGDDDTVDCDVNPGTGITDCLRLPSNEFNPDVDACLNQPPAGLGDFVFEDKDVDGIQDPSEPGIPELPVTLLTPGPDGTCNTPDDQEIDSTETDSDGMYRFERLDPGDYCVKFEKPPADFCSTDGFDLGDPQFTLRNRGDDDKFDSDADRITGVTGNINLEPSEFDDTNDAGIYCPAKLGNRVWEDEDGNGRDENDELGIGSVEVQLFECGEDGIAGTDDDINTGETRMTDNDGMYMFGGEPGVFDLEPGRYFVKFIDPEGRAFTTPHLGDDIRDNDSDCLPPDGNSRCITLNSKTVDLRWDCGLLTPPPECDLTLDKKCRVEPRPTADFDKCDGKLQQFTLIWNGSGAVTVNGLGQNNLSVAPGDEVTFFGSGDNDVEIDLSGAVTGRSIFHLSCSDEDFNDPSDCGKLAGNGKKDDSGFINQWLLEGFIDKEGRILDCTADADTVFTDNCTVSPGAVPSCDTTGKPDTLTWRYDGGTNGDGNCADSTFATATDEDGKTHEDFRCSGTVDVSQAVTVTTDDDVSVAVQPGDEFTTSRKESKKIRLSGSGSQNLEFHTSCSQPIAAGLTAGALTLVALDGQRGTTPVTYQYEVSNNGDPVFGIGLTDDRLGEIAGLFDLDTNERREFRKEADIAGTTVNTATATGRLSDGSLCSASDTVTVEAVIPPTPVSCKDIKDIEEVLLEWDGTGSINIRSEHGQVINNIEPGDVISLQTPKKDTEVTISGAAGGTSTFHVSCSDEEMDGSDDCGKRQGNGKKNEGGVNDWLLKGMIGEKGQFTCP